MPDVIAWPPLRVSAHGGAPDRPGGTSYGLSRAPQFSQSVATRETYAISVSAIGNERAGAGYIDMLRRQLDGKLPLVRIQPLPQLWFGALRGLTGLRGEQELVWYADGRILNWDITWKTGTAISATAEDDSGWDAIRCTGLPASRAVAFPGEIVRAETGETARVLKHEVSDATGSALIRLDSPIPTGDVLIGARDSLVMMITDWPDPMLSMGGGQMTFQMTEVFASDFDEAFTEVNPWS